MSGFNWTEKATLAAIALAEGKTRKEAAGEADITDRTLYRWLADPEFGAEVDRLSLMVGIAGRAERLRLAQRVIRQKTGADGTLLTKADLLEWLKFAQSETDGVKLDLAELAAALGATATPVAN
jgi:transposase-like protein